MISKKRFWLAALIGVSMLFTACQGKSVTPSSEPSGGGDTSSGTTDTTPSSDDSSTDEKTVSQIIVKEGTSLPVSFVVGDTFSVDGGILQVRYSDATREEIPMTLAMIENAPDMTQAHENYEVHVLYEGARTSYVINVVQGDTREEVSIGISYEYNNGDAIEITNFEEELVFVQGKDYKFHYGAYPSAAVDSLARRYLTRAGVELDEKPTEIGEYTYKVFLADGDENYKPTAKTVNYKIVEPVINTFVLDKDNVNLENNTQIIDGITINYKGATATDNAVATLTRVAASKPGADDNYIEIASPVFFTEGLTVEFEGINRYVYVYCSYDGESFELIDTLTRAKQTSDRVNRFFYVRLVCSSAGEESTVIIKKVSFKYEVDAVPSSLALRAEQSDLLNDMVAVSEEDGPFYRQSDELYNSNLSTKAVKMRNFEAPGLIDLKCNIASYQARYTKFSFKFKLDHGVTFQSKESGQWVDKSNMSFFVRPYIGNQKYGINYKINTFAEQDDWTTVEFYLGDMMGDDIVDITTFRFWINRKLSNGFVYVDDFRMTQSNRYPVENTIYTVSVVDGSVPKTEFNVGETFAFGGSIKVVYTDYLEEIYDESDERVSITAPDMSTSGEKNVTITFTYYGVSKATSYKITVIASGNPKDEETMTIVSDTNDLANNSYRCNPEVAEYMGCATTSNETEMTYGDSQNALRIAGPTYEEYCHATINLPATISADSITVRFFAKNLPCNLILQLRDENEAVKAQYSSELTTGDCTTDQTHNNKFTATDAGNGWTFYEHTYYTTNVTGGVKRLRILFRNTLTSADQYCVIDGLEVFAD